MTEPVRLAKRLAEMLNCSRSEAEQYIAGGWVSVDGLVVEEPQFRVLDQIITLSPDATLLDQASVTLLLHKPAGYEAGLGPMPGQAPQAAQQLLSPSSLTPQDGSGVRPLKKHFTALNLATPLAAAASGLVVFTQDWRIVRKLTEDASVLEHEVIVEVTGTPQAGGLERLNRVDHGFTFDGKLLPPAKVSWQNETRLRFALKGELPGQIAFMCESVGLRIEAMKRIRVGRVPMRSLPAGQWRYLLPHERF
ncbi:MAG: rRNA pseudouridine synthase [Polaromonas sp.]|nr:rRNA pseudouridine synthase [Polaromonas sp.]